LAPAHPVATHPNKSPEGEIKKSGGTRLEKLSLKLPIEDRSGFSDKLIHPWLGHDAIPLFVNCVFHAIVNGVSTGW
jgi:hypothetical protein